MMLPIDEMRYELADAKKKLEAVQKELAETRAILADQRGDLGRTDDWVAALEASGQRVDLETLLLALEFENDYDGERRCGSCSSYGFHLGDCMWLRFACAVGGPSRIETLFEQWCERQVAIEREDARRAEDEARRARTVIDAEQFAQMTSWGRSWPRFAAELERALFVPSALQLLKPKVFSDATELQKPPDGENIDK